MINSRVFFTGLCFLAVLLTGCAREEFSTYSMTGTIEARDGVPIVYETVGEGEVAVVFIHCWACNRAFWRHQIQPVAEAGYRVVVLDLPGHGDSGADRDEWSNSELAADVVTVVKGLDIERAILVGHAIGGSLALEAASQLHERVIGVGCAAGLRNAEFEWPEGFAEALASIIGRDFRQGLEQYIQPFLASGTDPELLEWIVHQAETSDQSAVLELMVDFPNMDLPALFSNAGVPIRCINAMPGGNSSSATEIDINRKYADFDAVLMEGVGQYPQLEQPEAFNARLLDILAELSERKVP